MTELEHIEIEGFKGLEHVEFEPTDINLITGRNNTGKTSFLEAVDLLFNPEKLVRFRGNVGATINVNSEICIVCGETENDGLELRLRQARKEEVVKFFTMAVAEMLEAPSFLLGSLQDEESEEINEVFDLTPELGGVLERKLTERTLNELKAEFLVLSIDDERYPYFIPGQNTLEVMSIVYDVIERRFSDRFGSNGENIPSELKSLLDNLEEEDEYSKSLSSVVSRAVNNTGETFLKEPENSSVSRLIESIELTEEIERTDDEDEPIKIDDIGDYIKDTGLVDGLKTFTLDYLVFEENGEKQQIPYEFMGDGFKSIVGLLWELMDDDVEDQIVLIEEPETHMHPGYIREVVYFLIELAREEDVQLFITTHDSDFINDFFTENLTDEEEAYLEDEFSLLRMEEDSVVVEDYETARENLKDLHLDLRGI